MPERDVGHEQTEKILQALERRIAQVYREAADGVRETIDKYFAGLVERDKYMRALVQKGEITEDYYAQWLQNQIGRGERFEALQNQLAERVTNAAETAYAYINDATPSVYSLNRNYGAYTIERATGSVGFTMWNESAVRRLLVQQPELMPHYPPEKALKRGIDLEWGKKQIRAAIQSGILQGKSIGKIANDLQKRIPDMSRKSAIRAARTAMTGAQNGGRQDSYEAAKRMGIKAKKRWIATLDGRTRDSHRRLHGEIAEIDDKFSNGLMFPGDERGRPTETYNCRCDMVADVESLSTADGTKKLDPQTQSKIITNDITYGEWAGQKSGIISKDVKKKSDYIGRVYGKTDGQSYITPEGDTYTLTGDGAGKTKEVPKNEDGGVKVYKAPNNSGFLNGVYVNDENKNAIYSNGRIVLNNSAYNNNLRDQMKGMIENETLRLGGLREDGVWYRGTDNPKEIEYIKSGKLRASKNHMTGAIEDGVSVWETPKYSFKYTYQVSGEFVGIGSDGEPLISPDSVKLLSDSAISAKDVSEAMERGKQEFLKEYSWTEEQYDKALKGEYDWKGDLR